MQITYVGTDGQPFDIDTLTPGTPRPVELTGRAWVTYDAPSEDGMIPGVADLTVEYRILDV